MAEQKIGYLWSNPPHFICYYSRAAVTVVNVRPGTVSVNTSGVQVSDTDVFRVLTQLFLPRNTKKAANLLLCLLVVPLFPNCILSFCCSFCLFFCSQRLRGQRSTAMRS